MISKVNGCGLLPKPVKYNILWRFIVNLFLVFKNNINFDIEINFNTRIMNIYGSINFKMTESELRNYLAYGEVTSAKIILTILGKSKDSVSLRCLTKLKQRKR